MLDLYKPEVEDLWFREKLLSDEETMSWDHAAAGTIPFPESEWRAWHESRIARENENGFYRYLRDRDSGEFVGEIAYYLNDERLIWSASVIIISGHRGKGYGKQGLRILCELAAEKGIEIDDRTFPPVTENGFVDEYWTDDVILLRKDLKKNKMIITEAYEDLMFHANLPERFRAGDFGIFEDEEAVLDEFVNNFYEAAEKNGYVNLWDFTELMAFIDLLRDADTEAVQNILIRAFIKSAQMQNALWKGEFTGAR